VKIPEQHRHLTVLARVALVVAFGDWLTKAVAARAVAGDPVVFTEKLRFAVVHNDAGVFGWSAGMYTWQLNLALTLAAIALMIPVSRELARIDDASPRALGLIMGGALGNFGSLLLSPPGVVDFISVSIGAHSELVLNVADVAAYIGLAMVLRTGFLIVGEIRRTAHPVAPRWVSVARPAFTDREVSLPVALADSAPVTELETLIERPESVRRAELADLADQPADSGIIDIRPHLASRAESRALRSR
jgi:signal peptidase II